MLVAFERTRIRFPPPPLPKSLKDNELPEQRSGLAASGQRRPDAACPSMASFDAVVAASLHCNNEPLSPAVAQIAAAWPGLPPHIRDAILTLVDAGKTRNEGAAPLTSLCLRSVPDCLPQGPPDTREIAWQLAQQCRSIVQACLREEEWQDADREFCDVISQGIIAM
jgi:hypothetical protein